jgi:N-acetylglucosaminyldiphosphoundecaprenol N-acetyl-beta-D-mannosaminyltransferase
MGRRTFLECPVDDYTEGEICELIKGFVSSRIPHQVAVLNANKVYLMSRNERLRKAMIEASLVLPENAIYFASKWVGKPLKARDLGGFPLMKALLEQSATSKYRFYFLGSTDHVVNTLVEVCRARFSGLCIAGWHHGYVKPDDSSAVVTAIRESKPDILLVAMGSPTQELWIADHLQTLGVPVCVGVGGSFEVLAGFKKVAPRWTKYGFEWLYRSIQDPKKLPHYLLVNLYFVYRLFHCLFLDEREK